MLSGIVELVNSKIFKLHVPSKTRSPREAKMCRSLKGLARKKHRFTNRGRVPFSQQAREGRTFGEEIISGGRLSVAPPFRILTNLRNLKFLKMTSE